MGFGIQAVTSMRLMRQKAQVFEGIYFLSASHQQPQAYQSHVRRRPYAIYHCHPEGTYHETSLNPFVTNPICRSWN